MVISFFQLFSVTLVLLCFFSSVILQCQNYFLIPSVLCLLSLLPALPSHLQLISSSAQVFVTSSIFKHLILRHSSNSLLHSRHFPAFCQCSPCWFVCLVLWFLFFVFIVKSSLHSTYSLRPDAIGSIIRHQDTFQKVVKLVKLRTLVCNSPSPPFNFTFILKA